MMKIFYLGCESGDWVLPIYEEKNRVRKSHATVPFAERLILHVIIIEDEINFYLSR